MSRLTYTANFYCRASKANRNGDSPIELSIIINGSRTFIQLPIRCKASEFNKLVSSRKSNPIKDYVEETKSKLLEIQVDMLKNNIPFTSSNLREYYKNGGVVEQVYTISNLFDDYIKLIKPRIGVDLTEASYNRYIRAKNYLLEYIGKDIVLSELTPSIMQGFHIDLNSKYQESTVCGIMTRVKTIIKYALDNGKISKNPFINIKYGKGRKEIHYLTQEELNTIYNLKLDNKSLEDIRDCFILQASTGLSYIDLLNLKKEDIQIAEDSTHYIVKNRHKTNIQYTTVVLPMGVEVLKKHNYQLRVISNQKYNLMLKNIQALAGIDTNITSHLARKTFATLALQRGVRMETVSKMLGHSNISTTSSAYAKLLNKTVIEEAKKIYL